MIFNEALYPIFLLITVGIFFWVPISWRAAWLFISGLIFYAYYADIFVLLFGLEAMIVFVLIQRFRKDKWAFLIALILSIAILGYFKYRNMALFTWESLAQVWTGQRLPELEHLILPLAISFFTFEFIHYLVDMRQGKIEKHSLMEFLAFIMFFPTMIAGPIKRFQEFIPQLKQAQFAWENLSSGLLRILIGSAKKILIADSLDLWIQPLQGGNLAQASPESLWIALLAYSLKIYLDFSGYSDMAIGSARLFGINVPENFNFPYLRPNIALFWRHWHISLTNWITDYVFIPLGGSRTRLPGILRNTILAMLVSGIWHGAAWHFVFWGLYHGGLLALHRLWRDYAKPHLPWLETFPRLYYGSCTLFTFILVTLGWGLFILPLDQFGQLILGLVRF